MKKLSNKKIEKKEKILNRGISNAWETLKEMFNILSHQENANQKNPEIPPYSNHYSLEKKLKEKNPECPIFAHLTRSGLYTQKKWNSPIRVSLGLIWCMFE